MIKSLIWVLAAAGVVSVAQAQSAKDRAEFIVPDAAKKLYDEWHFAPAVKIDGRIYASGVVAVPRNNSVEEGYRHAWRGIATTLKAAGASLDDVVELTTFHTDLRAQLPVFMKIKDEFIKKPYPAWTAIGITELAVAEGIVEIRVTAHMPAD